MISFIICSIDPKRTDMLAESIKPTVGVDYEIIIEDNRGKARGISQAYNEGAWKSKHDYLCFVHEDVLFHGDNWGKGIELKLSESETGIIGFMGATYKSKAPSGWNVYPKLNRSHFIQTNANGRRYSSNVTDDFSPCAILDGACLFMRKDFWQNHPFDNTACPGFHCYDIDICLQAIHAGYKNYVCGTCWIEHFSEGSFNKDWATTILSLHTGKWKSLLPIGGEKVKSHVEARAFYVFLKSIRHLTWNKEEKKMLLHHLPYPFRHPVTALKSLFLLAHFQ